MRNTLRQSFLIIALTFASIILGSWTGGPYPEVKSDSLAIVRVVKPINELFEIKPVVYVSKGLGKIDQVSAKDAQTASSTAEAKKILTQMLLNGYTIESTTELVDGGLQLNTYYLKKKVI